MQQLRPKGSSEPFYNPQRDIAYLYSPICQAAFGGLDEKHWQEWFGPYLRVHGITEQDLGDGVAKWLEAHRRYVHDLLCACAGEALQKAGFLDCQPPVRMMIYAKLGEVLTTAFFQAVREVTSLHDNPPQWCDLPDFYAMGLALSRRLLDAPPPPDGYELAFHAQLAEAQRLQQLLDENLPQCREALAKAVAAIATERQQLAQTKRRLETEIAVLKEQQVMIESRGLLDTLACWWQNRKLRKRRVCLPV